MLVNSLGGGGLRSLESRAGLCFVPALTTTFSLNIDEAAVQRGQECLKHFAVFGIFVGVVSVVSRSCRFPSIFFP